MSSPHTVISTIRNVVVVGFDTDKLLDPVEIEATGQQLYALVDQQAQRRIVLDFSEIRFLSSQMLGVIINLQKRCQAIDGRLVLCGLKPDVRRVLRIANLDRILELADDEEAALNKLGVSAAY